MINQLRQDRILAWQNRQTAWDDQYQEYIKSPLWRDKANRVLKRDQYICQACLKRKATQVHHQNYQYPLGKEPLFVLVAVCQDCHKTLHKLDPHSRPMECDND